MPGSSNYVMSLTGYIPHSLFHAELLSEIKSTEFKTEDIYFSKTEIAHPIWPQDVLRNVQVVEFQSIKDAARVLLEHGRWWFNLSQSHHRRSQLIQENLRTPKVTPIEFLDSKEKQAFGTWGLLDQNKLFFSTANESYFPKGDVLFAENKSIPPSRAYLKLWELFTLYKICPSPEDITLDMGSCPGGWSWVLSQVSKKVISVDKAPLDDKIAKIPNIEFFKKDAFKLDPLEVGPVNWFFSDIICEPLRLFELVEKWSPHVANFVCTVKFKGATDLEAIEKFQSLKPTLLTHLYNNKHEITFVKLA